MQLTEQKTGPTNITKECTDIIVYSQEHVLSLTIHAHHSPTHWPTARFKDRSSWVVGFYKPLAVSSREQISK